MKIFKSRTGRRVATAGGALVVALGVLTVSPAEEAQAASYKYLQINICGNKNCDYDGSSTAGTDIANSVASSGAAVVSINELCGNQLTAAKNNLAGRGLNYQAVYVQNIAAGDSRLAPACKGFGNGLLIKYTSSTAPADFADRRYSDVGGERRSQMCAHIVSPSYYFCTLHLASGGSERDATRDAELDIFFPPVKSLVDSGKHVVVAGDFNMGPANGNLNRYYTSEYSPAGSGRFREVDGGCYKRPTTEGGDTCNEATFRGATVTDRKLDYIFVSRPGFGVTGGDVTSSRVSDHDPLYGNVGTAF